MNKIKGAFSPFIAAVLVVIAFASQAQDKSVRVTSSTESSSEGESVLVDWKQELDYEAITTQCRKLARVFPHLVQMESIGESANGKRIWALTISNKRVGNEELKPAYFLDGSTLHDATVGPEHALYLATYLAKSHGTDKEVTKLLDQKTFYIVPISFPDTRTKKTSNLPKEPEILDEDHDGKINEDGPEDLNNDGIIGYMRRRLLITPEQKSPLISLGGLSSSSDGYEWLGVEGFDNDRDGKVNEDHVLYQGMDQDWAWNWSPPYGTQSSTIYPFSIPENRALKDFILRHPNIAGAQIHYTREDLLKNQVGTGSLPGTHEQIRATAGEEEIIRNISHSQKWNWLQKARGLHMFPVQIPAKSINEKTNGNQDLGQSMNGQQEGGLYKEWLPFEHPTFGSIEISGFQAKMVKEVSDDFLEKDLDTFCRSSVAHAQQLPQLVISSIDRKVLKDGLLEVTAIISNIGLATHTKEDLSHKLERANFITLRDGVALTSSLLGDSNPSANLLNRNANRVEVNNIPANSSVQAKWVVKATTPFLVIEVDSRKGGVSSRRF